MVYDGKVVDDKNVLLGTHPHKLKTEQSNGRFEGGVGVAVVVGIGVVVVVVVL